MKQSLRTKIFFISMGMSVLWAQDWSLTADNKEINRNIPLMIVENRLSDWERRASDSPVISYVESGSSQSTSRSSGNSGSSSSSRTSSSSSSSSSKASSRTSSKDSWPFPLYGLKPGESTRADVERRADEKNGDYYIIKIKETGENIFFSCDKTGILYSVSFYGCPQELISKGWNPDFTYTQWKSFLVSEGYSSIDESSKSIGLLKAEKDTPIKHRVWVSLFSDGSFCNLSFWSDHSSSSSSSRTSSSGNSGIAKSSSRKISIEEWPFPIYGLEPGKSTVSDVKRKSDGKTEEGWYYIGKNIFGCDDKGTLVFAVFYSSNYPQELIDKGWNSNLSRSQWTSFLSSVGYTVDEDSEGRLDAVKNKPTKHGISMFFDENGKMDYFILMVSQDTVSSSSSSSSGGSGVSTKPSSSAKNPSSGSKTSKPPVRRVSAVEWPFPIYGLELGKSTVTDVKKVGGEWFSFGKVFYVNKNMFTCDDSGIVAEAEFFLSSYPQELTDKGYNPELSHEQWKALLISSGYSSDTETERSLVFEKSLPIKHIVEISFVNKKMDSLNIKILESISPTTISSSKENAASSSVSSATEATPAPSPNPEKAFLGISVGDPIGTQSNYWKALFGVNEKTRGILVLGVCTDSPAYRDGIKPGDYIVAVNGKSCLSLDDWKRLNFAKGAAYSFSVVRKGKKLPDISVKLDVKRMNKGWNDNVLLYPGFVVTNLIDENRKTLNIPDNMQGVAVIDLRRSSIASCLDIKEGDVITAVMGTPVKNTAEFYEQLPDYGKSFSISIYRGGKRFNCFF